MIISPFLEKDYLSTKNNNRNSKNKYLYKLTTN